MEQLLAQAMPSDRSIEKTARSWLAKCHEQLDKTTHFSEMLPEQAALRKRYGDQATYFGRVSDGTRSVVVRCSNPSQTYFR